MLRLLIALLLLMFCIKSDAELNKCDFSKYPKRPDGCFSIHDFAIATQGCTIQESVCMSVNMEEKVAPTLKRERILFAKEDPIEKQKVIKILSASAKALLKNPNMKNVNIVLYDKQGKFSVHLIVDAERFMINKGVRKDRFKIKVIQRMGE